MRGVAAALDTGAASLYVYVPGRDGLLQAMVDRVIATIEVETPDPSRWRDQLHSLVQRMRRALLAHPGIAAMFLTIPPMTDAVLRLTENLLATLLAGGVDPQDAAWASDIFLLLSTAVATENDARHAGGHTDGDYRQQVDKLRSTFAGLPADRFPALTARAAQMVAGDPDERFQFAIDVVIDGIVARSARA
jgi:AcrR family transcriptional regulator